MRKKRVLVCGASGFIGRNVFEFLSRDPNLEVYGTCHWKGSYHPRIISIDLTDKDKTGDLLEKIDIVIQAAAMTDGALAINSNPAKYMADNIAINNNLLEAAHSNKVGQFIFLSCSVLYPAFRPDYNIGPVAESDVSRYLIHPSYRYWAEIKLFFEEMCRFYSSVGQTHFTVIRHSNNYGPYDKFNTERGHLFGATVAKILNSTDTITVSGDGSMKRDFLHVHDLVRAIDLIINTPLSNYEIFNIGSGTLISVRELVKKICTISGREISIVCDLNKPTIDTEIVLDITRAKNLLGWKPLIDIDEGIRQTVDWYLKNQGEKDRG